MVGGKTMGHGWFLKKLYTGRQNSGVCQRISAECETEGRTTVIQQTLKATTNRVFKCVQ